LACCGATPPIAAARKTWRAGGAERQRLSGLLLLLCLDLSSLGSSGLSTELVLLGTLALHVFKRHTNDGLLELLSSLLVLGLSTFDLSLLVHSAPCLRPGQFDGLDLLVEQGVGLGTDKEADLSILGDELLTTSRVDLVLRVVTDIGLDHHFRERKAR